MKRGARLARVRRGHPWVFANEVEGPPDESWAGQGLPLVDERGYRLGWGIYNPASQIVWRRYSATEAAWDGEFLRRALDAALARREDEAVRRVVWSEADDLPGVVADQFGEVVVLQTLTLGADRQREVIARHLRERLRAREVIFRDDAPSREMEGLERRVGTLSGQPFAAQWFQIEGLSYFLDLQGGQKTGFYLDQRREQAAVAGLAAGRRTLDAFCHLGGFALQAAKAGAAEVLGLDISAEAIDTAMVNARHNDLPVAFEVANVFDWLTAHRDRTFDLIILDPPSFARNKQAVAGALRGYKELNLRALQALTPGGWLCTYSCSQHVTRDLFLDVVSEAAHDARRPVSLWREMGQPPDHPVRLNFPESHYLKGFWLRVER